MRGVLHRTINILAGSTLGGGTRVNWQASFKTPDHVRREWAEEHGLKAVASERYTAALDAGLHTPGRQYRWTSVPCPDLAHCR